MKTEKHTCAVCGKTLNIAKSVSLELSSTSNNYFKEGELPAGHESQGFFDLGSDCARVELRKTADYLKNA